MLTLLQISKGISRRLHSGLAVPVGSFDGQPDWEQTFVIPFRQYKCVSHLNCKKLINRSQCQNHPGHCHQGNHKCHAMGSVKLLHSTVYTDVGSALQQPGFPCNKHWNLNLRQHCKANLHTKFQRSTSIDRSTVSKSHVDFSARLPNKKPFSVMGAIVENCPKQVQPYLKLIRLDRPTGSWLLFIPGSWSIAMATAPGHLPDLHMLALFGLGAMLMRGAGCIINDFWDKDIDARVSRTKDRPLVTGQISSFQALCFLGLHLSAALSILLTFNWYSVVLGASVIPLVAIYPYMKRITYWPQVFLGVTCNWGCLLGWSVLHGSCYWPVVLPLYAATIAWVTFFDTIYAHQDKEDDKIIGMKSTALLFGDHAKPWLAGFASLMVSGLTMAGIMNDQPWLYFLGLTSIAAHFTWQISTVNLKDGEDCFSKFKSNRNLGLLVFAIIVASNLVKSPKEQEDQEKSTL